MARCACARLIGTERDAFESGLVAKDGQRDLANLRARTAVAAIVDESGARLFSETDTALLGGEVGRRLDRLFEVAQRLNGVGPAAQDTLVKPATGTGGNSSACAWRLAMPTPTFCWRVLIATNSASVVCVSLARTDRRSHANARADYRAGVIAATLANYAGKTRIDGAEPAHPADFASLDDHRSSSTPTVAAPLLMQTPEDQAQPIKASLFGIHDG